MDEQMMIQDLRERLAAREAELGGAREQLAREVVGREQTERALRESEERFRLLVEHSHDVVYSADATGMIEYVSPGMSRFGYTPEELISKHFGEFIAPEQIEQVIESFETGTRAGTSYPTVFQFLKKDGSRAWVEVVGRAVFDQAGRPIRQVGVMRDINERKLQEETTRSLELLLETLDAACWIKDRDGIFQYVNRAFEHQFSVKKQDLIGQDDAYVFGEENAQMLRENDLRVMGSRETQSLEEGGYLPDGRYAIYVTRKTPIINADDKVTGICGVGIEITYQKQIEKELRESGKKFRHLVEQISDVIYTIDTSGELTYVSPAVESLLGYSPEEMEGRRFVEFIAPEDAQSSTERFQQLSTGVEPGPNQYRLVTKVGEVRWIRTSSQPILDGGQVSGIRGVLTDITKQMNAESQKEATLEALRESEERWRSLTETSPDHILTLDADLHIQFANFASPGLTVEDLIGTPLYTYVEEERQSEIKAILEGVLKTGTDASYETVYYSPDGMVINYESSVTPRRAPDSGEIVGLTLSSRDISERKQAEEALRASQELFQSALDALAANIAILGESGQIIAVNASWRAFADENGLAWTDYGIGRNYLTVVDAASGSSAMSAREAAKGLRQVLSGQRASFSLTYPCHSSHEERWFVLRVTHSSSAEGNRVVVSHENITSRVHAEAQLERAAADAERERLSRDLHDSVTQTLFSIAAIAEVLPDIWERDSDKARRGLHDLHEQTQGALAEMRALLLAWRPEGLLDGDLGEMVHQLADAMAARTRMPVTVTVEGECEPPAEVKLALYRITQEALNNVVKHAGASRAVVHLQCTEESSALSIRDNGKGFDSDSVGPDQLGLGIMRERAQVIGAAFAIASEPESGTEITVAWEGAQTASEGQASVEPSGGETA